MEIIEKQIEKVKEIPADGYYTGYCRRDINGKANAGLALGIVGTALGAWALFGNRRTSLLGGLSGSGMGGSNININGLDTGSGVANGITSPSAFQAWEKSCDEALALTNTIWGLKVSGMDQARMPSNISESEAYEVIKNFKESSKNEHFNEPYARYLVSNMCHFEGGRKHVGEKFDITKAKEVCERYRGIIPQTVTHADVYVAINSQYHDYSELFKTWFGDGVEQRIIESAIIFWFKDDDYKSGFKLWNYFKEN